MSVLDFREIREASKPTGQQDAFELFAREVLHCLGLKIVQGPARGADLGKDLIVEETRVGPIESTKIKWLVSCKHFAASGNSVRPDDERNIIERVAAASCDGFLGFYSTLPSSGLSELLHRQSSIAVKLLDREEIERHLLNSSKGKELIERYFPISAKKLKHVPAEIFADPAAIECDHCGKDLLHPPSGIFVLWYVLDRKNVQHFIGLHFACKGACDRVVENAIRGNHASFGFIYDGWDDIPDLTVPTVFITKVMALLNGLAGGDRYEPEVLGKLKHLLLATFPFVSRHLDESDKRTLERLQRIPAYVGGMGYNF